MSALDRAEVIQAIAMHTWTQSPERDVNRLADAILALEKPAGVPAESPSMPELWESWRSIADQLNAAEVRLAHIAALCDDWADSNSSLRHELASKLRAVLDGGAA